MGWLETYRGVVHRWEVDNVDHFTVAHYFGRFDDAMLALLEAAGLGSAELAAAGRSATLVWARVRYRRELRVGDVMHIRSGVIGAEEDGLVLGHELYDSGDGALCTSVEQGVGIVDATSRAPISLGPVEREGAETCLVPWDGGPEPAAPPSLEDGAGFVDTARDTVKPWEVDTEGFAATPAFIHRFTAANGHLLAAFGMTPAYMRRERRGFSTFEFNLAVPGAVRAGDLVRVRSALTHIGKSSIRILHRLTNAKTGALVATLEQSGVQLDLDARRPAALADDLRLRANAMLASATPPPRAAAG